MHVGLMQEGKAGPPAASTLQRRVNLDSLPSVFRTALLTLNAKSENK